MQIQVENVSKEFVTRSGERRIALSGVSLACEQGDFIALLGPSGCGKTTLLNIIAGLDKATSGSVKFEGKPVTKPGPERGVIFQHYSLFPWLSVRHNVEFGLRYKKMDRADRDRIVDRYLELVGLSSSARALPRELSGGMKQRCALARALAVNPQTLLMDEPFAALDAFTRRQLQIELLEIYAKEQKTVIFVTHDVDEAVFLARRIAIMATMPGRIEHLVEVPFQSQRNADLPGSDEFVRFREFVWERIPQPHKPSESPN